MVDVSVQPFEIEVRTRHGDLVRADVYLPEKRAGKVPVLLGASPCQKALRHLPPSPVVFPFVEYGPMQLYRDEGYAHVAMDVPGMGRSEGTWDPVSRAEGEAIHDMIEHVATLDWAGPIGMSYYCWSQWNTARTRLPHLVTIGAFDGATDMYRDWMHQGGIPIQGFLSSWLYSSVNQADMDVMVKLSMLPEGDGKPPFVRGPQDWLRASHRAEVPELTTEMRPFLRHDRAEPIIPGEVCKFRVELLPMSVLVAAGERLRLEISNWDSAITEAPMTHWYGQKVGTETYHHDAVHPSRLRLHERPRAISTRRAA